VDPRVITFNPSLPGQGHVGEAGGEGVILFWRIRYLDSGDKQFKNRDLWLDTAELEPVQKAAVELCAETKDPASERKILRFRGLFQERAYSDAEWKTLLHKRGKMRSFFLYDYLEDQDGNEVTPKQMAVIITGNPDAVMFPAGVRQHDVDYMRSEHCPIPLDQFKIPTDALGVLGYFARDIREMEMSAFFRDGAPTLFGSTFGGPMVETAVTDEEIRSFVTIFRRLCITKERGGFSRAVSVFCSYTGDYPMGRWVQGAAKQFEADLASPPQHTLTVAPNGLPFTRKQLIEAFIYTQYLHQPDQKRQQQIKDYLAAVGGKSQLLTWLFLTELWYCGRQMDCVGGVIADFYDNYCECHRVAIIEAAEVQD
jgi:hypothetical protein